MIAEKGRWETMDTLKVGDFQLVWLNGGKIELDGGGMFGVVPKTMWSKRYPCNVFNQIELRTDPILIQANGQNLLIDTGVGSNKFNEKQKMRFGIAEESTLERSLAELGLTPTNIDHVLLTHFHNDHAAGLTRMENDQSIPVFTQAIHHVQAKEWDEVRSPNNRTRNTYLKENWQPVEPMVRCFEDQIEVTEGIQLIHTGGHSAGHYMVRIQSKGEIAYHFADIMPTHVHKNPLWVMAYDDYPMDSIFAKEKWVKQAIDENAYFTFYHDYFCRAVKWDSDGKVIEQIKATTSSN